MNATHDIRTNDTVLVTDGRFTDSIGQVLDVRYVIICKNVKDWMARVRLSSGKVVWFRTFQVEST